MTEFVFENIPVDSELYMAIDDGMLYKCNSRECSDLSVGEHRIKIICKNKSDMKCKFEHLSSKHKGAFVLSSLNYEVLSFEYIYKIRVLKRNGKIEFDFVRKDYKNFLGYKSTKTVISATPERIYVIDSSGPYFLNQKQRVKFMLFQIFNIVFSMLPYLSITTFILWDHIKAALNKTPLPSGGFRSIPPMESIFIIDIPVSLLVLVYCVHLIVKSSGEYKQ